jgi:hypothetical protein
MKVNLTILERVVIMNILPQMGNVQSARAIRNTKTILKITDEEKKVVEAKLTPQGTLQGEIGDPEKTFELPHSSTKVIKDTLTDLDKKSQLSIDAVAVYDKFFPSSDKEESAATPA